MKKTKALPHSSVPVTFEHARLRQLSDKLRLPHKEDDEILKLVDQLYQIGCGADANETLGVKRSKGQDAAKEIVRYKIEIAIRWIAGRMYPDKEEKPPKKAVAIEEAAEAFGLEVENLARACPNLKELKSMAVFDWDSQRPRITKSKD